MDSSQQERRLTALTRLAIATREKCDRATYLLYLEHVQRFSTEVVIAACRRLESSSEWFPKVAQLVEECRVVARHKAEQQEQHKRRMLDIPPVDAAKIKQMREMVKEFLNARRVK